MMNIDAIAVVPDSEQWLTVRLGVESDSSLQHIPFLNVRSSPLGMAGCFPLNALSALYSTDSVSRNSAVHLQPLSIFSKRKRIDFPFSESLFIPKCLR